MGEIGRMAVGMCLALALAVVGQAQGEEFFVATNGVDSAAADWGKTEATAFRTINAAIAAASSGSTITLLPGDHMEGAASGNGVQTVAVVTKPLTIRSKGRDYRDVTRIVGRWDNADDDTTPCGMGPNAVRCAYVNANASGTRLEGITFYKGATLYNGNTAAAKAHGGGVYVASGNNTEIVDCAFIDCIATRGGGLYTDSTSSNIQAHRCLFKRCKCSKYGFAMRGGSAYNCVFDDNGRALSRTGSYAGSNNTGSFAYGDYAVNCTFVNSEKYGIGGDGPFSGIYNCLFMNNAAGAIYTDKVTAPHCYCVSDVKTLTDNNCVYVAFTTSSEVYSPYDNDYRLVKGACSTTTSNADYLDQIPADFRDLDYYGNARTTDGVLHCGAVQEVADDEASGIAFRATPAGEWTFGGESIAMICRTWKASKGWPILYEVKFTPTNGSYLVNYVVGDTLHWPKRDDSVWVNIYRSGRAQTISASVTTTAFYTDPEDGDDSNPGTEGAPFKTLDKAVHSCSNGSFVVFAKAGDYCSAEAAGGGFTNRVVVPSTLAGNMRVLAIDGPETTFISGRAGTGIEEYGLGTDAVRCVAVLSADSNRAAFQGFTIRNGHSSDTANGWVTCGGAMLNCNSSMNDLGTGYLVDCVVKDCTARRGGVIFGGTLLRCRVEDCGTSNTGGGGLRKCNAISSIFTGCYGGSGIAGDGAYCWNCTLASNAVSSVYNGSIGPGFIRNCVSAARPGNGIDISGNLTADQILNSLYSRGSFSGGVTFPTAVRETPAFLIDATVGDYRLCTFSIGCFVASNAYLKSCMDLNGDPYLFDESGNYQAGCYALRTGKTFYASPSGNDANDGLDETSPFRTLAAAMAGAGYCDTVMALPGTYSEGTMLPTLAQAGGDVVPSVAARVVVKSGVTLASRDGADTTIIRGAEATGGGCGPDAVRGVFLCSGATMKGFTVTGGHTAATALADGSETMTVDNAGGGISGRFAGNAVSDTEFAELVENCIITGNQALRGGGAHYGTYRNCRFTGNTLCAGKPGWAVARVRCEGCLFSGNGGTAKHSTAYNSEIENCTVLGGQAEGTGAIVNENDYASARSVINTIICASRIKASLVKNCLLDPSTVNTAGSPTEQGNVTGEANLDESGVPLPGSPAIDAGSNALTTPSLLADRDPAGVRRVLNSTIDIGAYEFDWGVQWGAEIGNRRLVISDMPSDAYLSNGRFVLVDGTAAMEWDKGASSSMYSFNVNVTGNGELVVKVNGETIGSYTSSDGAQALRFSSALAMNSLEFSYVAGSGDTGGAEMFGFEHTAGSTIVIR